MAEQPVDKLAKAEEQIADLRQDRDQWREAQRARHATLLDTP